MAKASVMLRLGSEGDDRIIAALKRIGETGDAAMDGLSREAKNAARDFDRLEKGLDANARSAAQVAKTYVTAERAIAAGVKTQEEAQRIIDLAVKKHINLTTALNDNAHSYGSMISRLSEWGAQTNSIAAKMSLAGAAAARQREEVAMLAAKHADFNARLATWQNQTQSMVGRLDMWSAASRNAATSVGGTTKATQENAKAAGLARHEWINLSRQFQDVGVSLAGGQKPLTVLLQQGSQIADVFGSSQAGAGGALRAFGAGAVRALFSPVGAAAGLAAAVFGVKAAGDAAAESLAKLGEESRQTALTPNRLTGAKIVGARAGLDDKDTVSAFANAQKEFEAYSRNSGAVKDILEKVDKGFLKVLDSARSSSEWIDKVNEKIRSLPTAQAQELAKALYTPESGRKLFEEIQNGAVSMAALSREAEKAGANFDVSATHAEKMRHDIAEIDRIASTRLLATFGDLANPVLAMEKSWANMKLGILEVERSARQLRDILRVNAGEALGEQGEDARTVLARMRGLSTSQTAGPFAASPTFYQDKANFFPQLESPPVGETRKLFESKDGKGGAHGAAEDHAETYARVTRELENQLRLASSVGEEHDKAALAIKIQNEQLKLGVDATAAERDNVADLVTKIDAAGKAQKELNAEAKAYREAFKEVGSIAKDSLKEFLRDLQKGDSLSKALRNTWKSTQSRIQDKAVDKLVDSIFGGGGGSSEEGGILNSLFSSKGGGGLGSLFGNIFGGGGGKYFSSPLFSGSSFKFAWPFADGGIMTSAGPLPLHRYATGGIASSPQLAMFGEGRAAEAFVPLPDGRSIPVTVGGAQGFAAPRITINNNAAVDVTQRVMDDGQIMFYIEKRLAANNRNLPSILADRNNRR